MARMSRSHKYNTLFLVGLFAWLCGCGEPEIIDGITTIAETGGDDGIFMPDVDLPAEGEPAVLLATGECVQIPLPGAFGYTHQCEGRTRLSVHAQDETYDEHFDFGPDRSTPTIGSIPTATIYRSSQPAVAHSTIKPRPWPKSCPTSTIA